MNNVTIFCADATDILRLDDDLVTYSAIFPWVAPYGHMAIPDVHWGQGVSFTGPSLVHLGSPAKRGEGPMTLHFVTHGPVKDRFLLALNAAPIIIFSGIHLLYYNQ